MGCGVNVKPNNPKVFLFCTMDPFGSQVKSIGSFLRTMFLHTNIWKPIILNYSSQNIKSAFAIVIYILINVQNKTNGRTMADLVTTVIS